MQTQVKSSEPALYSVHKAPAVGYERSTLVAQALAELDAQVRNDRTLFDSPKAVRDYLILHNANHADLHVERFSVMFLDSQNRLIEVETMFTGTLSQTSVYPREVARAALRHNAAAVVLSHNHPSGNTRPSRADECLTQTLKQALMLLDIRVLDHIITAGGQSASMAEMGLV
jgi:DNA repair protein RadC